MEQLRPFERKLVDELLGIRPGYLPDFTNGMSVRA